MSAFDPKRTSKWITSETQFTKHLHDFQRSARAINCDRQDPSITLDGGKEGVCSGRERMNKFFALLLVTAAVGASAVATQAMPLGSNQAQESLVVLTAGGCGAGFHRGP